MISKITPDRSKIVIEREDHVKFWTRHFGVTEDELARAIERVAACRELVPAKDLPLNSATSVPVGRLIFARYGASAEEPSDVIPVDLQ